jgi:hypothetical protein
VIRCRIAGSVFLHLLAEPKQHEVRHLKDSRTAKQNVIILWSESIWTVERFTYHKPLFIRRTTTGSSVSFLAGSL